MGSLADQGDARALLGCSGNTVDQSSLMLITVQPCPLA
jgi:hypothetical protein